MDDQDVLLLPLTSGVGSNNRGWVQLARPTDGVATNGSKRFELTDDDMQAYAASIRASVGRVPIDYDHSHSKGSGSRAAGWVDASSVEVRPGAKGAELWAIVDWTPAAANAIRAGEFRFISPEITFQSTKDGVLRKAAKFLAAALTNRPFLDMAAVRLSLDKEARVGTTLTNDELAERTHAVLLEQHILPSEATQEQYLHALRLAQAQAQGYTPGASSETGPVVLRGDYRKRHYAVDAAPDASEFPVDADSVERDRRITLELERRSKDWGRPTTVEDYLQCAKDLGLSDSRVSL